jgi:multiple sugar transport system permease protein
MTQSSKVIVTGSSTTKQKRSDRLGTHIVLLALGVLYAVPFLWLLSTSLKAPAQIFTSPPVIVPNPVQWDNYLRALTYIPYLRYFGNTLYIALFNVVATVLSCSLTAYGFARIKWPGRDVFFYIMISTLMIPSLVTLIPTFLIFRELGWVGTMKPLTWPAFTGSAFFIFLLRQFFMSIPQELSEAAKIEGASELQIYWRIILPLSRPALSTVALFTFMGSWNDFLGPLIYLSKKENYTLAVGLYGFFGRSGTEWGLLMAAATIMILPVILLFFFAQKTFIQGASMSGLKG